MAEEYKVQLGVDLKVSDIRDRITQYNQNKNNAKLKLGIKLDTDDIKKQIDQLNFGNKGGKGVAIPVNTQSLETSLKEVNGVIADIKTSIGTLDSKSGMKSLLSSINQISNALEKVSNQFESLNVELKTLGSKDFGINLGVNLGSANPIGRNAAYGNKVRNETLPQLKQQMSELVKYYNSVYKSSLNEFEVLQKMVSGTKLGTGEFFEDFLFGKDSVASRMSGGSLASQMQAYKQYIDMFKQAASLRGLDLTPVTSSFSQSADTLIKDAQDIQTGANEMQDGFEKIKQVFGSGGINAEGLSASLEPIIADLNQIREAVVNLSKGVSVEGLTKSFDRLSESIENLVKNATKVKSVLGDGVSNLSGSINNGDIGVSNIESDLKQVTTTANNTADAIRNMREMLNSINVDRSSIDAVAKDMESMGISIKNVSAELKGSNLNVTVEGIDNLGETVTIMRRLDTATGEITQVGAKIKQSFSTSDDVVRELNKEMANFVKMQNKISNMKLEIKTLESQGGDANYIAELKHQLETLENTYDRLMQTFSKKLFDNSDIVPLEDVTKFNDEIIAITQKTENKLRELDIKVVNESNINTIKEINSEMANFVKMQKQIGNMEVKIKTLESQGGDADYIAELNRQLKTLENTYDNLMQAFMKKLSVNADIVPMDDIVKFNDEIGTVVQNTQNKLREVDIKIGKESDAITIKEINKEVSEFIKLQKQIENTRFQIDKLEISGDSANKATELKRELKELENTYDSLMQAFMKKLSVNADIVPFNDVINKLNDGVAEAAKDSEIRLEQFKAEYADTRAELAKGIKLDIETGNYDNQISQMDDKFNRLSSASTELRESVEQVHRAYEQMELASKGTGDEIADRERLIQAEKEYAIALEKTNNLLRKQSREEKATADAQKLADDRNVFQSQIDVWLTKNSAATKKFGSAMLDLKEKAENCDRVTLNHLEKEFRQLDNAAEKAGLKMQSSLDRVKSKFKEYMAYFSVAEVFMYVEQGLRSMFEQVKLIDSAMIELKKVTDETDASYNRFLSNAADRAKAIGTTIDGFVKSTADFARLGYGFEESQGLAEVANIYAVVGDDIDSVETATQSLISTLTAFKDEANGLSDSDFALSIVDKMNEVSNNFAISSGGIGDALQRSASSMMAANNSLDETIALITAANTVVQDPEQVGRLMPTLKVAISVKLLRRTRPRKDFIL